jgi:hypothetical protein
MLRCEKSNETQFLKSKVLKFSQELKIKEQNIEGKIFIENLRFYKTSFSYNSKFPYTIEVDVTFQGLIRARGNLKGLEWFSSKILTQNGFSKIKINRFIRKSIVDKIQNRLSYFGLSLNGYYEIKRINWK